MASLRQIEANRRNAQRSTGPRTDAGKSIACMNRLRHGLRAETAVLPEESQEKFDALCADLAARYLPEGIDEEHLVEQMAVNWWRAARTGRMVDRTFADARRSETGHKNPHPSLDDILTCAATYQRFREGLRDLSMIELRYERSYERARKDLERLQKERRKQEQLLEPEPLPEPEAAAPDGPADPAPASEPAAPESPSPAAAEPAPTPKPPQSALALGPPPAPRDAAHPAPHPGPTR